MFMYSVVVHIYGILSMCDVCSMFMFTVCVVYLLFVFTVRVYCLCLLFAFTVRVYCLCLLCVNGCLLSNFQFSRKFAETQIF